MFLGSLVALVSPFNQSNQLDSEALQKLVIWHVQNGTDAIVVGGTTGEAPTLNHQEKLDLLEICLKAAEGKIKIIAGTGTYSTAESKELTKQAKELGADGSLVVAPYYNKPTQEGLFAHFQELDSLGLPIIVYHHPGRTGVTIQPQTFTRLQTLKNIVAIKEASGSLDFFQKVQKNCSLPVLSGDDSLTVAMMQKQAKGVISVIANLVPKEWKQMTELCLKGDFLKAKAIENKYKRLCQALFLETNPQGVKYALSLMGKCQPFLRLPLLEPRKEVKTQIKQEMKALNLI